LIKDSSIRQSKY